jgi:hypothetical protein
MLALQKHWAFRSFQISQAMRAKSVSAPLMQLPVHCDRHVSHHSTIVPDGDCCSGAPSTVLALNQICLENEQSTTMWSIVSGSWSHISSCRVRPGHAFSSGLLSIVVGRLRTRGRASPVVEPKLPRSWCTPAPSVIPDAALDMPSALRIFRQKPNARWVGPEYRWAVRPGRRATAEVTHPSPGLTGLSLAGAPKNARYRPCLDTQIHP